MTHPPTSPLPNRDEEENLLMFTAMGMRRHGDAALDGTHRNPGIPEEWAYALIVMGGWVESYRNAPDSRDRDYALAACRSFIHGSKWVDV